MATPNVATAAQASNAQAELEEELRQAERDFANGDFIELTIEQLDRCIAAWLGADPEAIAACVTTDCVAIECYRAVYRGRDKIQRWAQTWFAAGGIVHRWDVS